MVALAVVLDSPFPELSVSRAHTAANVLRVPPAAPPNPLRSIPPDRCVDSLKGGFSWWLLLRTVPARCGNKQTLRDLGSGLLLDHSPLVPVRFGSFSLQELYPSCSLCLGALSFHFLETFPCHSDLR